MNDQDLPVDDGGEKAKIRKKRKHTFSAKCLAARRVNARKSTGPTSAEGKAATARNSWRHGLNAASTAPGMIGKLLDWT